MELKRWSNGFPRATLLQLPSYQKSFLRHGIGKIEGHFHYGKGHDIDKVSME